MVIISREIHTVDITKMEKVKKHLDLHLMGFIDLLVSGRIRKELEKLQMKMVQKLKEQLIIQD